MKTSAALAQLLCAGNPFSLRALVTYQPHIIYEQPDHRLGNVQIAVVENWRSRLIWTGDPDAGLQPFNLQNRAADFPSLDRLEAGAR